MKTAICGKILRRRAHVFLILDLTAVGPTFNRWPVPLLEHRKSKIPNRL
jgi:hypothetical protein